MHVLGIDPGFSTDPTGMVLARVSVPAVVVSPDGALLDAATGARVPIPEGTTAAEYALPRYEVVDARQRRGITFARTVAEARAIRADLGELDVVADATGLGRGLVESLRRAGMRCHAVTLTGGERPGGRGPLETSMPVVWMFAKLYEVMAQDRIRVAAECAGELAEQLKGLEHESTATGNVRIEGSGADHHSDQAYALAMLVAVVDRMNSRASRQAAAAVTVAERPRSAPRWRSGRVRTRSVGRGVIEERLEDSRRRAERDLWAPIRGGV